jgi:hypothetical protein
VIDLLERHLASVPEAAAAVRALRQPALTFDLIETRRRELLQASASDAKLEASVLGRERERLAGLLGDGDPRVQRLDLAIATRRAQMAEVAAIGREIARAKDATPQDALFVVRVLDGDGNPVPGATAYLTRGQGRPPDAAVVSGKAEEDGTAALILPYERFRDLFDSGTSVFVGATDPQGKPVGSSQGPYQLRQGLGVQVALVTDGAGTGRGRRAGATARTGPGQ